MKSKRTLLASLTLPALANTFSTSVGVDYSRGDYGTGSDASPDAEGGLLLNHAF